MFSGFYARKSILTAYKSGSSVSYVSVMPNNISLRRFNEKKLDQGFPHPLVFNIKLSNAGILQILF